jgi:carboxylate-amine ligase
MKDIGVTLGVEEEYLLLDVESGLPSPRAPLVRDDAGIEPGLEHHEVDDELLQAQVEVATPVCRGLDEVTAHLTRLRRALANVAEREGCRLAPTGAAPLSQRQAVPVTHDERYRRMRNEARLLVDEQLICGMHIHVAVPDRSAGAGALGRLRPWLPVLVALGANSPFWEGRDTGFSSWRTVVFGRWPVSGPPPFVADADAYEERVEALMATGVIPDRRQLYWQARLSEQYPTLEVRAPDVQLDVADAVTLAGLTRALVTTALQETADDIPALDPPASILHAAGWHAARHGLTGTLVDPRSGRQAAATDVVAALLHHVGPVLKESGDAERVTAGVDRILDEGTGSERQRAAESEGGMPSLLTLLTQQGAPHDQEGLDVQA